MNGAREADQIVLVSSGLLDVREALLEGILSDLEVTCKLKFFTVKGGFFLSRGDNLVDNDVTVDQCGLRYDDVSLSMCMRAIL